MNVLKKKKEKELKAAEHAMEKTSKYK